MAVQGYQYFRDICKWRLLNHDSPLILGGRGVVVQKDESLFCHKPKVIKLILQQSSDIINHYVIHNVTEPLWTPTKQRQMGVWDV